jgi:hypothetical protein
MGGFVSVFPNSWETIALSELARRRAQAHRLVHAQLWPTPEEPLGIMP